MTRIKIIALTFMLFSIGCHDSKFQPAKLIKPIDREIAFSKLRVITWRKDKAVNDEGRDSLICVLDGTAVGKGAKGLANALRHLKEGDIAIFTHVCLHDWLTGNPRQLDTLSSRPVD